MTDVVAGVPEIHGPGCRLVPFAEAMIDDRYMLWLTDPEVSRFLEFRHTPQTRETALRFVRSFSGPEEKYMFAIQTLPELLPIGTCTLYGINRQHGSAEIGLLIGEKEYWGRGVSKVVISLLADFAFGTLGLRRLTGGSYSRNHGMNFTFRLLGFALEGTMRQAYLLDDEYVDGYRWALLVDEWNARRDKSSAS